MNHTNNEIEKEQANTTKGDIYVEALMGPAGCGKSFEIQRRVKENNRYAVLASTTGVSAANLGENVTTVHSLLKFYDLNSLKRSYDEGWLRGKFIELARRKIQHVVIDEVSMLSSMHLDLIYQGARQAAEYIREQKEEENPRFQSVEPVGLICTGDFLQLPPVDGQFCFYSNAWKNHFSKNVKKMEGSYRHENKRFLDALNAARAGKGVQCAMILKELGVKFVDEPERHFDGTTLFPTNSQVDKHNRERLAELEGEEFVYTARQWGKQKSEWERELPTQVKVKVGCLVMCLINEPKTFRYVNGDLATVLQHMHVQTLEDTGDRWVTTSTAVIGNDKHLPIKTKRNNFEVLLPRAIRKHLQAKEPTQQELVAIGVDDVVEFDGPEYQGRGPSEDKDFWVAYAQHLDRYQMRGVCYQEPLHNGWVIGEYMYMPIKIGYAITVHKAQGLSLDRCQIDVRSIMSGKDGIVYVALSRVRSPEGLQIVGSLNTLAKRISTSGDVREWI